MSTHNVCFHEEIRKILCGYPLLSVAMMFASHQVTKSTCSNFMTSMVKRSPNI